MIKYSITFLMLLSALAGYAQPVTEATASKKALKYLDEGVQRAMAQYTAEAVESFKNAIAEEPDFVTAWEYLGDTYKRLKKDSLAADAFLKSIDLVPDGNVWTYMKLAESEGNLGRYEDAYDHINIFLDNPTIKAEPRTRAERMLVSYTFGKDAVNNPVDFKPVNMGGAINSEYPEYCPSISVDGSTFVVTRRIPAGSASGGNPDQEDFYISYFKNDIWSTAQNMGEPINNELNQGAQNISADGRYLFYTYCDDFEAGYGSCDLYYSVKIGNQWTYPENCGNAINTSDWESQPSVSADGKYLFFSSARPGCIGSYDLWMSSMGDDGYWQEAKNLGPEINTIYSEQGPFIHPDGTTLYFNSDGHPGMGSADLFYSKKNAEGKWSKPVNLGYPINTNNGEISLAVSANGTTAYFASDRGKPIGDLDIYSFELPKNAQANRVTYVKAIVTDGNTGQPVKANVQLMDIETGEMVTSSFSDPKTGEFLVVLPIGKDYSLYVQKENYLFHSENFSLLTAIPDEPFIIGVKLHPIEAGEVLTLKNIFFETASAGLLDVSQNELNKVVELMLNNPDMKIRVNGHTDNVGSETDNMQLSLNRSLSVKNYLIAKGIEVSRISNKGFGESKPIDDNTTEQAKANNRRTEIEILSL